MKSAARYLICLKLCDRPNCATCRCIQEVCENPKVVAVTSTEAYIKGKKLSIAVALGDNWVAWQKFARETLGLGANVCQTHATAIAANNSSHKKFFDDINKNNEPFYEFVNCIMRCSFASVGEGLQELLVEWLRSVGEERTAKWFNKWWCRPTKGQWLLGHGRIAMTGDQRGLESKWQWDRQAISHWHQVRRGEGGGEEMC
jgi:hypothetical protein